MKKLKHSKFKAAAEYIQKKGRPLDKAWFRYVFKGGDILSARKELETYQCIDGGFGKMLEPDHRTMLSSCYTTSFVFSWFSRLEYSQDEGVFIEALNYLKKNYIEEDIRWRAFPAPANKDPHAVWWHYNDGENLCDAEKTWGLPSAEIVGIMLKYESGNKLWEQCFEKAVTRINEVAPVMDISEASCYVRMISYLEGNKEERVMEKIIPVLKHIVVDDPEKWNEYSAKPLMYIHSPDSPFYEMFKELTEKNLDWEIDRQNKDGSWSPEWQWYRDEEFWPQAKAEWQSYLTVEKLVLLKSFGRIEGVS